MKVNLDAWADEYVAALYTLAQDDFGLFRQLIHSDFLWGWWTDELARELTQFYLDLIEGRRPKLALMAPPQHGKSTAILDFIAWIAGKYPDLKMIFASYSDELSTTGNRHLFRTISGNYAFCKIFPNLRVGGGTRWAANNNLLEFVGHQGSFRNTTVDGPLMVSDSRSGQRVRRGKFQTPTR